MLQGPTVAALVLFVYYAVTFTKFLFDGIARPRDARSDPSTGNLIPARPGNPGLQNGLVRLWALVLGVVGAVLDAHLGNGYPWATAPMYDAVKAGAAAAIVAIITYHVGQPGFLGAFGADASPVALGSPNTGSGPLVTVAPLVVAAPLGPAPVTNPVPPGTGP